MSKKLTITTLVLLASLGVVVSGCVKKPVNQPVNQNANTNANTATSTTEIDTSNWKTYRNAEYGFEFKYPEEFVLSDPTGSGRVPPLQQDKDKFYLFLTSKKNDGKDFFMSINSDLRDANLYKVSPGAHKKILIDNIEADAVVFLGGYWEGELANPFVSIYLVNNNSVFHLNFANVGDISDEIQGILDTFKLH